MLSHKFNITQFFFLTKVHMFKFFNFQCWEQQLIPPAVTNANGEIKMQRHSTRQVVVSFPPHAVGYVLKITQIAYKTRGSQAPQDPPLIILDYSDMDYNVSFYEKLQPICTLIPIQKNNVNCQILLRMCVGSFR